METDKYPVSYILDDDLKKYRQLFIENCGQTILYDKNTMLSRSGEPIRNMYFLLEGVVKIFTVNKDGYVRLFGFHGKNTIFAMDGMSWKDDTAVVCCESVTPVSVLKVSREKIRELSEQNADFMRDILSYYCDVLRLMCYDAEKMSIGSALDRVASFLLLFDENLRRVQGIDKALAAADPDHRIEITRDELASAVNASRVQVSRICSQLKKDGIIGGERGTITVLNRERLAELLELR